MSAGEVIDGRFELEEFVARGGMGEVWRAIDRTTGSRVALKLLEGTSPARVQRSLREARALRSVSHPAVVGYVAHAASPTVYLATEWIDGCSLAERLRAGPIDALEALTMAERIATGLGVAHAASLVHRDVKPSNIMLPDGDAARGRLIDFGIVHGASWDPLTRTGAVIGTPEYMAPEQVRGDHVGAPADVFALGCVLFKSLSGTSPYRGDQVGAILTQIAMFDAPPRLAVSEAVPAELSELVADLMAAAPAGRPADGHAAAHAIQRVRAVLANRDRRSGPAHRRLSALEVQPLAIVFAALPATELGGTRTYADSAPGSATDRDEKRVEALRVAPRMLEDVRVVCRAFGAEVDNVADSAVAARIVGGVTMTDLAVRAARCALAIRDRLPDAAIGTSIARAVLDDFTAVREVVEQAVSLVRRERPGIVVDARVRELLPERFVVEAAESDAGGTLVRERTAPAGVFSPPRLLLGAATRCVGRNRLLRQLASAFDGCVEDREAAAVVVIGPAGIGKSRFRAELASRIEREHHDLTVLGAWGESYRARTPYGLAARLVRGHLGLDEQTDEAQRVHLREAVRDRVSDGESDRIAEFLGELCGVSLPDRESPRLSAARRDPELMADHTRRAFADWMAAVAAAAPVLVVVDDLHWADEPSVALIGDGLRRCTDLPLMVLALARPELQLRFPDLGSAWNRQELVLEPLKEADSLRIVDEALGADTDVGVRGRIVRRAAGNPFYLEELIRAAASGGAEHLPDSVVASVQLRMSQLPNEARRVLRAASIFGYRFWPAGVDELLDDDISAAQLDDWLVALERDELVERVASASGRIDVREYAFRHDLTRQAAYDSLTDVDRVTGHRLAGAWLERAGEADPIVLAEHFLGGGAPLDKSTEWFERAASNVAAGRGDSESEGSLPAAARFLLRAADAAAGAFASETAIALYDRAIALLVVLEPVSACRTRLALAAVLNHVGQYERAVEELSSGLETAPVADLALRTELLTRRADSMVRTQHHDAMAIAESEAEKALSLARQIGNSELEASALTCLALIVGHGGGDTARALDAAEQAASIRQGSSNAAFALWRLGNTLLYRNEFERARAVYLRALAAAEGVGDIVLVASCHANLGVEALRRWRIQEALEHTESAIETYRRVGHAQRTAEGLLNLATIHQIGGSLDEARTLLMSCLALATSDFAALTACREGLADIERHAGNESAAQGHLRSATAVCAKVGARGREGFFLGLLAESLWWAGEHQDAIGLLQESRALACEGVSQGLVLLHLGCFDEARRLLSQAETTEPDPDRRLQAMLYLARLAMAEGNSEEVLELCARARADVPASIARFAVPVDVLFACATGDVGAAMRALECAVETTGRHALAELVCDVGGLLASSQCGDEVLLRRFVELAERYGSRGHSHRTLYLKAVLLDRLGGSTEAVAGFQDASRRAAELIGVVGPVFSESLQAHPWIRAALEAGR